jgi:hypothetical protein
LTIDDKAAHFVGQNTDDRVDFVVCSNLLNGFSDLSVLRCEEEGEKKQQGKERISREKKGDASSTKGRMEEKKSDKEKKTNLVADLQQSDSGFSSSVSSSNNVGLFGDGFLVGLGRRENQSVSGDSAIAIDVSTEIAAKRIAE